MRWPSDGAWSTVIPCLPSTNQAPGPQGLRVPLLGYENRREDPCDTGDFKAFWNGAGTKGDPLLGRPHTSNLIGLDVSQVLCL